MANTIDFSKIEEVNIVVENIRMNISPTGVWIDDLLSDGKTAFLSVAMAWEEMTPDQIESYSHLYKSIHEKVPETLRAIG